MRDHSQSPWYAQAKEHWANYRPKMFSAMQRSGRLNLHLNNAVEQTQNEYARAIGNGMEPDEAWEAVRENHLFLPSEEDMPSLGVDPNPQPDPSSLASTTPLRPRTRSEQGVRGSSTPATSRPLRPFAPSRPKAVPPLPKNKPN